MKLWLVRHAPVLAPEGLCYGALDLAADAPATQAAARALAAQLPQGLRASASPLQRCEQMAEALHRLRPDLTIKSDERLREMDFGAWEGQPWNAIARADFDAWLADFAHARAGGHGECVRDFMARVGAAWNDWRAIGQDAVWIAHAGVIRAALLLARGVPVPDSAADWPREVIAPGGCMCLEPGD